MLNYVNDIGSRFMKMHKPVKLGQRDGCRLGRPKKFQIRGPKQCDQMDWLFVQFLATYDNENFPYYKTICISSFKILPKAK